MEHIIAARALRPTAAYHCSALPGTLVLLLVVASCLCSFDLPLLLLWSLQ
jgi:hypothetical protein